MRFYQLHGWHDPGGFLASHLDAKLRLHQMYDAFGQPALLLLTVTCPACVSICADMLRDLGMSNYLRQKLDYLLMQGLLQGDKQQQMQQTLDEFLSPPAHSNQQPLAASAPAAPPAADNARGVLPAAGPATTAAASAAAEAAGAPLPRSTLPAAPAQQESAMQAAAAAAAGSRVKPFPAVEHVPGAGVSQTFLTSQLHQLAGTNRVFKRSVIDAAAASARIVCVDFQHEPTKYVHANGGRSFTAIFNLIDITTGGKHACGDVTDGEGIRYSLRRTSNGGGLRLAAMSLQVC